jgi:Ran GTPase-activating protein (RanGAP) involved in mRNA processing and transport
MDAAGFASLGLLTSLRSLRMAGVSVTSPGDEGAVALADALRGMAGLRELELGLLYDADAAAPAAADARRARMSALLPVLAQLTSLVSLRVSSAAMVGPEGAPALASALRTLTKLETLNVACNDLGPAGAMAVVGPALILLPQLTRIELESNNVGTHTSETLAAMAVAMCKPGGKPVTLRMRRFGRQAI